MIPKFIESLNVTFEYNLQRALEWCDAAMMLRIQMERQEDQYIPSLREYIRNYRLTRKD